MTRSEKKALAKVKRLDLMLSFNDSLTAKLAQGKSYQTACQEMANAVTMEIKSRPQEKLLIIEAWNDFFKVLQKMAKELKENISQADNQI